MIFISKILVAFLLVQFKLVIFVSLVFITITYIESNKILQTKPLYIVEEKRYVTQWIYPQTISKIPDTMPLISIIFTFWHNIIFDITYNRIKYGNFFWIKNLNLKTMLSTLMYGLLGTSRLTICFVKFFFKIKTYADLIEEIFKLCGRSTDTRLIYNENNTWRVNGKRRLIWNIILENLTQNNVPEHNINAIKQKLLNIKCDVDSIKNIKYPHYEVTFIKKDNPKIQHTLLQGLTKNNLFGGLQTSFEKAQKFGFYNKQPLVYKYAGIKKESTLLYQDLSQIQIISEKKIDKIANIIAGAHINGYNETLVTAEFTDAIQQIAVFKDEINSILIEYTQKPINLDFVDEVVKISIFSTL